MSDLFGVKGRDWLRGLELPEEEDETVKAGLRHIEFLDSEIEQVERLIAKDALQSPQIKRLMTVPGVNVICAAIFLAAVGDVSRFKGQRKVVAYLGLDPRVYQSGLGPARSGRISKQALATGALGARRGRPFGRPAARTAARLLRAAAGPQRPQCRRRRRRAQARRPVLTACSPAKHCMCGAIAEALAV